MRFSGRLSVPDMHFFMSPDGSHMRFAPFFRAMGDDCGTPSDSAYCTKVLNLCKSSHLTPWQNRPHQDMARTRVVQRDDRPASKGSQGAIKVEEGPARVNRLP